VSTCSARVGTGSAADPDDKPVEAVTLTLFSLLLLNGVVAAGTADDAGSLISQAVAGAVTVTKAAAKAIAPEGDPAESLARAVNLVLEKFSPVCSSC